MLTILTRSAALALALIFLPIAQPIATASDYFVEAVVFSWNDVDDSGSQAERWKIPGRDASKMPSRAKLQDDNPAVAKDRRLLTDAAARLVNNGNASLLKHQAWTQSRAGRGGSPQVVFNVNNAQNIELELSGWILAYESSLLYVEVDLALEDPNGVAQVFSSDPSSQYLQNQNTGDDPQALSNSSPGNASVETRGGVIVTTDAQGNVSFSNRGSDEGGSNNSSSSTSGYSSRGLTYRITERRRVKFDEIHYIDHPRFGVLFTISRNNNS